MPGSATLSHDFCYSSWGNWSLSKGTISIANMFSVVWVKGRLVNKTPEMATITLCLASKQNMVVAIKGGGAERVLD